MKNSLHGYALLLAICTILLIITGAALTNETRPLPGSTAAQTITVPAPQPAMEQAHHIAGWSVAVLTLGLAVWTSFGKKRTDVRVAGWLALAVVVLEIPAARITHALVSPVFFSIIVAICVLTSNSWERGSDRVELHWRPLRILAILAPALVLLQIALGAAFRYNAMGVVSHIFNAMIVLVWILVVGVFVIRQYPEHPALRPAALALLIVAGIQVLLGFGVYLLLLMTSETNLAWVISSVTHVLTGALTLAASVVLAMQVRRCIPG